MYMDVLHVFMSVYYTHAWYPWKPEKEYHIPWYWSYRWMWVTMWVLGIEPKPSGRQPVLINLWTLFPAPNFFLRVIHFYFMWMGIFCFLPVCYICVPHIYSSLKDQKRSLDPLELELETVVSFHVDAGSEKQLYS